MHLPTFVESANNFADVDQIHVVECRTSKVGLPFVTASDSGGFCPLRTLLSRYCRIIQ